MTATSQAVEPARIVDELSRAIDGDPWHGNSVSSILRDLTASIAAGKPHDRVHSIWEIVRHMAAWTHEVARRLDGHSPGEPQEGDWPAPNGTTEDDWTRDVTGLLDAHRFLLQKVSALSDGDLDEAPAEARDRASGSGLSRYVLLHGLAQHHVYHAGQIALLKKMATSISQA